MHHASFIFNVYPILGHGVRVHVDWERGRSLFLHPPLIWLRGAEARGLRGGVVIVFLLGVGVSIGRVASYLKDIIVTGIDNFMLDELLFGQIWCSPSAYKTIPILQLCCVTSAHRVAS